MQELQIDLKTQGEPLKCSPTYQPGRKYLFPINYVSGIQKIDNYLEGRKWAEIMLDMPIWVFKDFISFLVCFEGKAILYFCLSREDIINIVPHHDTEIEIANKGHISPIASSLLAPIGILQTAVRGVADAISSISHKGVFTTSKKVKGSIYEIIVKGDSGAEEKITLSCVNTYKNDVSVFFNNLKDKSNYSNPEKKSNCYIATVCYGDKYSPEVMKFKQYRDEVLMKYYLGRLFVHFYYKVSPTISEWLYGKDRINSFIRKHILDRIYKQINKTYQNNRKACK